MGERERRLDEIRTQRSPLENHLIDELRSGHIGRREFIRRGTVVGMSVPLLGLIASACGVSREEIERKDPAQTGTPQRGGTIRAGILQPSGALDPVTVADQGGLGVLGQSGEYLIWSDRDLKAQPRLAESWAPSEGGRVWRFKIRQGVKFHDGTPMDAEDVAATFNRLADPDAGSNALSALGGVLSKDNTKAIDASTVEFQLDAPNGNFPFLTSSDNYNAIILPKDYDGDWEKTFIGTGPWKRSAFRPGEGVSYVPNREYWDKDRIPISDASEVRFYSNEQSEVFGLLGNEVDILVQFSVAGGKALLTDPDIRTIELQASAHRQVHLNNSTEQFKDKRTRQAMALLVNRRDLVDGLLDTKSDFGNDSPFAPVFPSTAKDVAQRQQDVRKAKELLAAAGQEDGFRVQLDGWNGFEMPDLAQLIQQNVRQAGIKIDLSITDAATYYGDATFGNSRWLDSAMGITEYGHRGVPNVLLGAPLLSKGTWNGAHFKNARYDDLVKDYTAAIDLGEQRRYAQQIQELLLDETPILFTYFYYYLTGAKSDIANVDVTAMGHFDLSRTGRVKS
jgi:peptide/nickel transport system substrate-binding protein